MEPIKEILVRTGTTLTGYVNATATEEHGWLRIRYALEEGKQDVFTPIIEGTTWEMVNWLGPNVDAHKDLAWGGGTVKGNLGIVIKGKR